MAHIIEGRRGQRHVKPDPLSVEEHKERMKGTIPHELTAEEKKQQRRERRNAHRAMITEAGLMQPERTGLRKLDVQQETIAIKNRLTELASTVEQVIRAYKQPLLSESDRSRLEQELIDLEQAVLAIRGDGSNLVYYDNELGRLWRLLIDEFTALHSWQEELLDSNSAAHKDLKQRQANALQESNQAGIVGGNNDDDTLPKHLGLSKLYQTEHDQSDRARQPHDKGHARQRDFYRRVAADQHHLPTAATAETIAAANRAMASPFAHITDLAVEDIYNTSTLEPSDVGRLRDRLEILKTDPTAQQLINGALTELDQLLIRYNAYLRPAVAIQPYLLDSLRYILNHGNINHAIERPHPSADDVRLYVMDAVNKAFENMADWFDWERALEDGVNMQSVVGQFRSQLDDRLHSTYYPKERAA